MMIELRGAAAWGIVEAGLAEAGRLECSTVTIAVVDAAGHRLAVARMDDRWFQVELAMAKAYAAVALRADTAELGPLLDSTPFWRTVPNLLAGRGGFGLGGLVLRNADGLLVGAVGAIGGSGDQDIAVAEAGRQAFAAGLAC
jgi:uncharacterized protein GlcG (DUF336 family)